MNLRFHGIRSTGIENSLSTRKWAQLEALPEALPVGVPGGPKIVRPTFLQVRVSDQWVAWMVTLHAQYDHPCHPFAVYSHLEKSWSDDFWTPGDSQEGLQEGLPAVPIFWYLENFRFRSGFQKCALAAFRNVTDPRKSGIGGNPETARSRGFPAQNGAGPRTWALQ
jgi:hypothetical protein